MSDATVQFTELVREEYHRIQRLKEEAEERGEVIENLTAAHEQGEITDQQYGDLLDGVL